MVLHCVDVHLKPITLMLLPAGFDGARGIQRAAKGVYLRRSYPYLSGMVSRRTIGSRILHADDRRSSGKLGNSLAQRRHISSRRR